MTHDQSPLPPGEFDWEALARYLAHESPPAEASTVHAWLAAHPVEAARLAALGAAVNRVAGAPYVDVETALRTVSARIDTEAARPPLRAMRDGLARTAAWRRPVWLAAAAVVVAAIGLQVARRNPTPPSAATAALTPARIVSTQVGQRDSVRLEDGTRVILGPATTLRVAAGFPAGGRTLTLQGEAYFDVVHDDAHPFTVRAGDVEIRDVGTTFDVHAVEHARVRVAVTSGVAELGRVGRTAVRLAAGDVGELGAGTQPVVQRGQLTPRDTAWMRGRVEFHDAPLATVATELRRWYGIDLRLADSALAGRHYTGSFDHEAPRDVLRIIALALGVDVVLRGDTAFFTRVMPRNP